MAYGVDTHPEPNEKPWGENYFEPEDGLMARYFYPYAEEETSMKSNPKPRRSHGTAEIIQRLERSIRKFGDYDGSKQAKLDKLKGEEKHG
jgi:hypothetical protein